MAGLAGRRLGPPPTSGCPPGEDPEGAPTVAVCRTMEAGTVWTLRALFDPLEGDAALTVVLQKNTNAKLICEAACDCLKQRAERHTAQSSKTGKRCDDSPSMCYLAFNGDGVTRTL